MVAAGPTETLTRVRLEMRPASRSFDSVSLPPLPEILLTVVRLMSPAGGLTSNVRRRETLMPSGPVTRTS